MICFPNIIFSDQIDDEIIKYAALAKEKSDMIFARKLSDDELKKREKAIDNFNLKIIDRNKIDEFYKITCSDLKFAFFHDLGLLLNTTNNNMQKKAVIANILKLHELLIDNERFDEDEHLQNLLLSNACEENRYPAAIKDIIKKNILSGSLAPIFSEITNSYKDKDIENFFNISTFQAVSLNVNRSTLYQFSMIAIKARHGDHTALNILVSKLHSLDYNDAIGVKYLPRLLAYTNQPEAIMQMLNVYRKPDLRPSREGSLYNYCACSLNMFLPGFPSGNAFLGIIGDKIEVEPYRKWLKENKDKYTINEVPFSRNKDLINDVIKSTLKNYRKNLKTRLNEVDNDIQK